MKSWFRFENAANDPKTVDVHIVDIIGGWIDEYWGGGPGVITAKDFIDQLSKLADAVTTIRLHVNSPGGDVFAAVNIANALRDQRLTKGRTVDVLVEGLAASSASVVIMAGSSIRISDNALVMVHNPWSYAIGNAADMRKAADELDTIRKAIVATYRWQSKLTDEELVALMNAATWMDADEAIANGFATEKVEGLKAAALLDPRAMARLSVPEKHKPRVESLLAKAETEPPKPAPASAADVLRLCREGECLDLAEALITEGAPLEQAQARVTEERGRRAEAATRATQIRALCAQNKLPELADGYIKGAMPIDEVKAHLVTLTAKLDRAEIDGSLPPDQGGAPKAGLNISAIYAERNRLKKE